MTRDEITAAVVAPVAGLRGWWATRWHDVAMGCYYVVLVGVGLVGLRDPSVSMRELLGIGTFSYAIGMISLGLAALVSVIAGSRSSEVRALIALNLLTVVHGVILFHAGPAGYQSGLRLMAAPFAAIVLASLRAQTTNLRRDEIQRHIDEAQRLADREATAGGADA